MDLNAILAAKSLNLWFSSHEKVVVNGFNGGRAIKKLGKYTKKGLSAFHQGFVC